MPFVLAGMVLFIFLGGWFAVWDWRRLEAKLDREIVRYTRVPIPHVAPEEMQQAYRDAIQASLIRSEIYTADQLAAALDRRPPKLEVVA